MMLKWAYRQSQTRIAPRLCRLCNKQKNCLVPSVSNLIQNRHETGIYLFMTNQFIIDISVLFFCHGKSPWTLLLCYVGYCTYVITYGFSFLTRYFISYNKSFNNAGVSTKLIRSGTAIVYFANIIFFTCYLYILFLSKTNTGACHLS